MLRAIAIVLLLFFLAGNSNTALNIHYCGGSLKFISMVAKAKPCRMCKNETSNSCCKDIQKLLKADDFNKSIIQTNVEKLFVSFIEGVNYPFLPVNFKSFNDGGSDLPDDIPYAKTPLYIRICSLVI